MEEKKKQSFLQRKVFSRIEKFFYLSKKAIYFAWYFGGMGRMY